MTSGTTDNRLNNSLPQATSQSSILSLVPTIGPLHISLNSREHIVHSYHPFFKTVYEAIFPRSKLADNPKPWRISLILEIVYILRLFMVVRLCSVFDRVVKQLNDEISNLNPATQPLTSSNLSQSQTYNQTTPSPNKAPPHCRQCHHPVRGHKRLNNAQVECYFCENGTCTVSDDISSSNCPCSWHTANQHESNQSTCNNQSASLPTPDSQTTLCINVIIAQTS